jgi:YD repeat-containing protein
MIHPALVYFECANGYIKQPNGVCVKEDEVGDSCDSCNSANNGGSSNDGTPYPIDIKTGRKSFSELDFETADGSLRIRRNFSTFPVGAAADTMAAPAHGFVNWLPDFAFEIHLGPAWDGGRNIGMISPNGAAYRFYRTSSGTIEPLLTTAQPLPRTDYSLALDGSWPSDLSTIRDSKTKWILKDPQNRTWFLETEKSPGMNNYAIARPVRMVEQSGRELYFTYGPNFQLTSVSDNNGKQMTFEWIGGENPIAISIIHLPDGSKLKYTYEPENDDFPDNADRLAKVEWVNDSDVVVHKTTYLYADDRFPTQVTGIRDKDDVVRWSVTYDQYGRATNSTGPSGAFSYSVAYGAAGSSYTRTVTNPLGKVEVYNYSRSLYPANNSKLIGLDGNASTNTPTSTSSKTYGTDNFIATETDEEGRVTAFTRNSRGLPTQIVEAQGTSQARTTSLTWDSNYSLATQIVAPGLTTTYSLDTSAPSNPGPSGPAGSGTVGGTGTAPHAYWRLRMLSNTGGAIDQPWIDIAEIEFRATAAGADQATGGTAIESGHTTNDMTNAFDNSGSTYWTAPNAQVFDSWVGYHFTTAVDVAQIMVQVNGSYRPRDFVVESSDDGSAWAVEWYVLDAAWTGANQAQVFDRIGAPSRTGTYGKWRVRIWRSNTSGYAQGGGQYANLNKLEFRESLGGADIATGGAAFSNGDYNSSYGPANAFDNDDGSRWAAAQPPRISAIGYWLLTPKAVGEVAIKAANTDEMPMDFAVQYFDGARWYVARDLRGETGWTSNEVRSYAVDPGVDSPITPTTTFSYTGASQTYTVPSGKTAATVRLWGGGGGNGNYSSGAWSGAGGYLRATFAVSPGDVLKFEVAGGGQGAQQNANGGAGGWPDGGGGGHGDAGSGGGGGSSRFYINNVLKLVAAGGGGSGGWLGSAGAGGGMTGQSSTYWGGTGGSQSAAGVDQSDTGNSNKSGRSLAAYPGTQRTGGWGASTGDVTTSTGDDGGGGGGGYYGGGGGGGDGQAGGGGSGYVGSGASNVVVIGGNRQTPASSPPSGVAVGVNSGGNGPAIPGGDGYAELLVN